MTDRKLIRANLALFKGERAEAERLLRQMRSENASSDPEKRDLMLWLDAQAELDREIRIRKLYDLINRVRSDSPYSKLAREYLQAEAEYATQDDDNEGTRFFGVIWWKMALFGAVSLGLIGLLVVLFAPRTTPDATPAPDSVADVAPQVTIPPDRSRPLVPDGFTARYDRGILQIAAIEDDSQRVMALNGETLLTPVEGARFYALNVYFECREGICETPPEAEVALRLDDGTLIAVKENAVIAGGTRFAPIALGRTTQGWLIFEIPVINGASALHVIPTTDDQRTPEPLTISLEGQ